MEKIPVGQRKEEKNYEVARTYLVPFVALFRSAERKEGSGICPPSSLSFFPVS